jgi:hypothetical protein
LLGIEQLAIGKCGLGVVDVWYFEGLKRAP